MTSRTRAGGANFPRWANRGIMDRRPQRKGSTMAAMKPRTGDGPLEVTKEGRGIVLRMPIEGGGRLVVEMTPDEAAELGRAIEGCEAVPR